MNGAGSGNPIALISELTRLVRRSQIAHAPTRKPRSFARMPGVCPVDLRSRIDQARESRYPRIVNPVHAGRRTEDDRYPPAGHGHLRLRLPGFSDLRRAGMDRDPAV